jgi:hypothetical protein
MLNEVKHLVRSNFPNREEIPAHEILRFAQDDSRYSIAYHGHVSNGWRATTFCRKQAARQKHWLPPMHPDERMAGI